MGGGGGGNKHIFVCVTSFHLSVDASTYLFKAIIAAISCSFSA